MSTKYNPIRKGAKHAVVPRSAKRFVNHRSASFPLYKRMKSYPHEQASLTVVRPIRDGGNILLNPNATYSLMNCQLQDFPRALNVATCYQFYRMTRCTLRFKPQYDTFATGGASKMSLYYMIDKAGALPTNLTIPAMQQLGAKSIQLDETNVEITWTPSVLNSAMYAGGGVGAASSSQYVISPWLSSNGLTVSPGPGAPSAIDHLGIYFAVEQVTANTQYSCDLECSFEYKKPYLQLPAPGAVEEIAIPVGAGAGPQLLKTTTTSNNTPTFINLSGE